MGGRARRVLWIDGGAGLVVGIAVLALHRWLAGLYGFSPELVLAIGVANVLYGSYSSTLAVRASSGRAPSRRAVDVLVAGNAGWAVVCVALIGTTWPDATWVGRGAIALEGIFVAGLAVLERRFVRPETR